jgi:SAM-dependent methyltransferase
VSVIDNTNGSGRPADGAADRRVFLGMPGYGEQSAGAAQGFWRATKLPDSHVTRVYREGSLLAANFNQLWCDALNLVHQGRRIDYFAMQHADVEPEPWWLDTLIDEMEAHNLDVLGAVVPIKDLHGRTSIALAHPSGDPWRTLCRLTLMDVYRMPATFTSADAGHPILLNTGLWVCRFDPAWAKKACFTINDRIVYDVNLKKYLPQCESEDWGFSRGLHSLGLKIGATRKVKLTHRGPQQFPNGKAWGEQWDSASVDHSPLPDHPEGDGFSIPAINGWLLPEEGKALADLARGKRALEVGSFCGLSTVTMARTAEQVTSVDTHDGRGTAYAWNTLEMLRANLKHYGVEDKVCVLIGELGDPGIYDGFEDASRFDLIFIDGAHDVDSVESDIRHAMPLLAPDGLLAFHDYRSVDAGVDEAVDALIASGGTLLSLTHSLAVVRPPASIPSSLEQPLEV